MFKTLAYHYRLLLPVMLHKVVKRKFIKRKSQHVARNIGRGNVVLPPMCGRSYDLDQCFVIQMKVESVGANFRGTECTITLR
jgi:hypothetical protein